MPGIHDEICHDYGCHVVGDCTDAQNDEGGNGDNGDAGPRDGTLAVVRRRSFVEIYDFEAPSHAPSEHLKTNN